MATNKRSAQQMQTELLAKVEELRQAHAKCAELETAVKKMHALQIDHAVLQGQIGEMRRTQAVLEQSRDRYKDLYEFAPIGYLTLSASTITHINVDGARLLGIDREQMVGRRLPVIAADRARFSRILRQVEKHGNRRRIDLELQRGDRTTFHAQADLVKVQNGPEPTVRVTLIDITERKRAEAEIRQLAFYDPLTGLPNRRMLLERLELAIALGVRKAQCGAVLFLDLDDFKTLNDNHGHLAGDLLLEQVGQRLTSCVRLLDTVGRFGGDEFVVILEALNRDPVVASAEALSVAEKIVQCLGESYVLGSMPYATTASVGIALFADDHVDVQGLLTHADIALYRAKAAGRSNICYFDLELQEKVVQRNLLLAELRQALHNDQFVLHFQPQTDQRGRWIGAEALLRWLHPVRGMMLPEDFLPLAEEQGLMGSVGQWVFRSACDTLKRWSTLADMADLTLAINISASEFRHPDFAPRAEDTILRVGCDPCKLMLEFTEGLLFSTMEETRAKMQLLRDHGVRFAVDDFGIGYSSLGYLQSLPLDQLKIDQSFILNMTENPNDAIIVRSLVALGQNLGLEVIAEGVETKEQLEALASQGCTAYQGFLFGRPVPEAELLMQAPQRQQRRTDNVIVQENMESVEATHR